MVPRNSAFAVFQRYWVVPQCPQGAPSVMNIVANMCYSYRSMPLHQLLRSSWKEVYRDLALAVSPSSTHLTVRYPVSWQLPNFSQVFQKGYQFGDTLVRPAMVAVAVPA